MKIIIVGYGEMLKSVIDGVLDTDNEIVGIFRHENIMYSPFKKNLKDVFYPSYDYKFIKSKKLSEIKAKSVNSQEFITTVKELKADLIITCSWSEKFSAQTINAPKIACINVHPSLLPKYRGPNPYLQVILNNESTTGITFHLMDINYDTGAILHQAKLPILPEETGGGLRNRCAGLAKIEVKELLNNFQDKLRNQKSQVEKEATYFHNISLADSILDFEKETSEEIDRRIRALTPWVKCHIPYNKDFFDFKKYKILTEISTKKPAIIAKKTKQSVSIVCKDGRIIQFFGLQPKRFIPRLFSNLYFNKIVKTNTRAI